MTNSRLKSTIHLVCSIGQPHNIGATQLTKSIVLADAVSFCIRRKTISGTTIAKADFGPVPHGYQDALNELVREKAIQIITSQDGAYKNTKYKVLRPPSRDGFEAADLEILEKIVREICNKHSAGGLSDLTHNEAWKVAGMGEEIPLAAYFPHKRIKPTPEEIEQLKDVLAERGYELV
jgi:hypothetical protein